MMVLTQGCLQRLAELLNKVSTKALTAFILLVILQVSLALHKVAQDNKTKMTIMMLKMTIMTIKMTMSTCSLGFRNSSQLFTL